MRRRALTCEEVLHHLFAYLDGELDAAARDHIERHLDACRGCFSRAEFERKLKSKVAETSSAAAPEKLRARVKMLIERF